MTKALRMFADAKVTKLHILLQPPLNIRTIFY